MTEPEIRIFIIEPINKNKYKTKIIYADSENEARAGASKIDSTWIPADQAAKHSSVYKDLGRSICIEVEPEIKQVDLNAKMVKIKYNDVIYDLKKDIAENVISESIF